MATPMGPAGEPFAEAAGEAVQTSVLAVRLVLAIADAVRRAAEERLSKSPADKPMPPPEQSAGAMSGVVQETLPSDIATALLGGADWPQMAQQLMALRHAGVEVTAFLPRVGDIAVYVRDAVAANAAAVAQQGTGEWARALRETMPAGPVREAILASPAWPQLAATMGELHSRGVDVRQILTAAHAQGAGVDQAVVRVMAAAAQPPTASRDALTTAGPLSAGLGVPADLDLTNWRKALAQLGVSTGENERFVRTLQQAMGTALEGEAARLVASRQWPLLAARMAQFEDRGEPVAARLAQLAVDQRWQQGPSDQVTERLVRATHEALAAPRAAATVASTSQAPTVSVAAARARSVAAPTAAPGAGPVPAPAAAATRTTGPGESAGRRR